MKQNQTSILTPRTDSRAGLVSLEALERFTAQLPTSRRSYRVAIVNCDAEDTKASKPELATTAN